MKGCRPLTDEEIHQVLEQLGRGRYPLRDEALFLVGIRTGFRISELLSLRIKNVFQNGHFVKMILIERRNMKGKKRSRSVPLHHEARAVLERLVPTLDPSPNTFLFQSRNGSNKPLNRRSAWRRLHDAFAHCEMTGKLGTHCMRKTLAKRMHELFNQDLMKTQKALGHARITSTVNYLSVDDEEIDEAFLKG